MVIRIYLTQPDLAQTVHRPTHVQLLGVRRWIQSVVRLGQAYTHVPLKHYTGVTPVDSFNGVLLSRVSMFMHAERDIVLPIMSVCPSRYCV